MNTTTATLPATEPAPFDYTKAERTVLDRAEFARLIRKHRSVRVGVFAPDYARDQIVRGCASEYFSVDVPAKQAIEKLNRCDFDGFLWTLDEYGPDVSFEVAPALIQIQRRRDFVAAQIPQHEARLARPAAADRVDAHMREWAARDLASNRAELVKWNAKLAELRAPKAAEQAA